MADSYKTLSGETTAEFRERGSRFLGFAFPVADAAGARARLAALRREHPKAVHHCLAYRIGEEFRASDDGEPSGSAGRPMLAAIDSAGLDYTAAIVVRYFGGVLLGVPGLIHAYRSVVADALSQGNSLTRFRETPYEIVCNYDRLGDVLRLLRMQEATVLEQEMQLFCRVVAGVRSAHEEQLLASLSDLQSITVKKL